LHVKETVEAEAMPAGMLRQLLREEIEYFIPQNAILATRVAEQSEREFLQRMAADRVSSAWSTLGKQGALRPPRSASAATIP
jgi:hypothetical protein